MIKWQEKQMITNKLINKIYVILIAKIIYFGIISIGFSKTFYVDPENGSMNNDGSIGSPWSTLESVFNSDKITTVVSDGDTLLLRTGFHGKPVIHRVNSDYITVKAQSGHSPKLGRTDISGGAYWRLEGLDISPENQPVPDNGYILNISAYQSSGNNIIVDNCKIYVGDDSSDWDQDDWQVVVGHRHAIRATFGQNLQIKNCNLKMFILA